MASAVTLFAVIATFWNRSVAPTAGQDPLMLYVWIAVATSLTAASIMWWRGTVVPLIERPGGNDWRSQAAALQTGMIVAWGLIEAAALFGVVVYFLEGARAAGALGVAMIWTALVLTWPRADWLETRSRASS
jgi:hypothetical protein